MLSIRNVSPRGSVLHALDVVYQIKGKINLYDLKMDLTSSTLPLMCVSIMFTDANTRQSVAVFL